MSESRLLQEKWAPVLNASGTGLNEIKDAYRRSVTAALLENQEKAIREEHGMLSEALPVNALGAAAISPAGSALSSTNTAGLAGFDPILISLIRRSMPNLIAYDIAGVQPMSGPTGLIFAMRARYQDQAGKEALFFEPDSGYSAGSDATRGAATVRDPYGVGGDAEGNNPAVLNDATPGTYEVKHGMSREASEVMGEAGTLFREMSFSIEKTSVTAKTRALKAEYTLELAQDLKAIHGLDAEQELANILSSEILAEINREIIRTVYTVAQPGAQTDVATQGTFDLDVDSNGRWMAEKFKGLLFQINRDANAIGQLTRRGKGNFMICSADVASAMSMAGMLDYAPALNTSLNVDDTGNVFAGVLQGGIRVYIDPFGAPIYTQGANAKHYYVMGYKGTSPYDAGLFYCPYVPLQMVRSINPDTFQPKIGFKTRYGMVSNPFVSSQLLGSGPLANPAYPDGQSLTANTNQYYRRVKVTNLT